MIYLLAAMLDTILSVYAALVQAQSEIPEQPPFSEVLGKMFPMFIIVFFIFYFMVIKPQTTKVRQQQSLIQSLKKGDTVVTSAGIIGKVAALEEDCVLLDVSNNVRLKVEKDHIARRKEQKAEK
ncbi:MAG: preprotein translocase subunit YajC [Deltaproteobacteria bacterium]|nr:preprotein translocase subunit YajC [Deltaproteobacteria bacterium]